MSSVRFVVGRYARHVLRSDTVVGWLGDDAGGPQQAGSWPLKKLHGGQLGLGAPGADVLAISAEGAQAIAAAGEGAQLLVGWPEHVLVVRRGGLLVYGEGDILHFGDLTLDSLRTLRRTGFDYLAESGADVRVHVELEERSAIDVEKAFRRLGFKRGDTPAPELDAAPPQPLLSEARLDPGQRERFGPYELLCERGYDYERRHVAGQTGHAYFFRLRRIGEEPIGSRPTGVPDPLAVKDGVELVSCARRLGLLDPDEVATGEPGMTEWLGLYEGPRGALEKELRAAGPSAPQLRWRGDILEAHAARLARGEGGAPMVGRIIIGLPPVGLPRVARSATSTLAGRLRRPSTRPPTLT